jgi:hypothetical protein
MSSTDGSATTGSIAGSALLTDASTVSACASVFALDDEAADR